MSADSLLSIDDGTTNVVVPSCSMFGGTVQRSALNTGFGEIEYADGSAKTWIRFERRALTITGQGPAPHGLWALDLAVATWSVTVTSFDNDVTTDSWTVIPNRPQDNRDINSGRTSWTIELRAAAAS